MTTNHTTLAKELRDSVSNPHLYWQGKAAAAIEELEDELTRLRDRVAQLEAERDEADRAAGAALRELAREKESTQARNSWLSKAKREWGVDDRVSFDVVWAEALKCREELKVLREGVARQEPRAEVVEIESDRYFRCDVLSGCIPSVGTELYTGPAPLPAGYALVKGGPLEWMQNLNAASNEPLFHEMRALMGTENVGQDIALLQTLRKFRARLLNQKDGS